MADIDFLALIEQGAERWNQWRADNPTTRPDLSHAYLFGQTLAGFNLSGVNLERACLIGTNLRGADLSGACLRSTYASSADFSGANLSGADLAISSFGAANFSNTDLSQAQAYGTNFSGACLSGACIAAWNIDSTTVLSGTQGSHVYLESGRKKRQPETGQFQPEALAPFLQLVALQPLAIPLSSSTNRGLSTVSRLKSFRLQSLMSSEAINQFKIDTISRANLLVSPETLSKIRHFVKPETIRPLTRQIASVASSRINAINNSAAVRQLRSHCQPDAADRVTPGLVHQLSPETITRINTRLKLNEINAIRLAAIGASRQSTLGTLNKLSEFGRLVSHSDKFRRVNAISQSPLFRQAIHPFKPDGVNHITPGVISRIDTAALRAQALRQIKTLFTPDAVNRVTPGALHQLSPDTFRRISQLLHLELARSLTKTAGKASQRALTSTTGLVNTLTQTEAFTRASTALQAPPIQKVAHLFKPDSVNHVTPGILPEVAPALFTQARKKARTITHNHFNTPAISDKLARASRLAKKVSTPKNLETSLKNLCDQHPWSTGLSATAMLTLLTVNFVSRLSNNALTVTGAPEGVTTGLNTELATVPATTIEVGAIIMPCEGVVAPTKLDQLTNGYPYENGAIYYGAIRNGQPADGYGTMVYPTGNRYDGEYNGGQRQGCGTFTFVNGRRYIGQFEADKFNGQGTWIIENGERYIGAFKNNQCSGQGAFIFANGSSKSGVWQDGKLPNANLSCDRGSLDLPSSQDM